MNYQEFFEKLNKKIDKVQITEILAVEEDVEYINDDRISYEVSETTSYNIKAEKDKKTVKVTTDYLNDEIIDLILFKLKYVESVNEDIYLTDKTNNNEKANLKKVDISDKFSEIEKLTKRRKDHKEIDKITIMYSCKSMTKRIINNLGVDISSSSSNKTLYCEAIAKNEQFSKSSDISFIINDKEEFDMAGIVDEMIKRAKIALKEEELKSGYYNILFEPTMLSKVISSIVSGLNAERVQKHLSMYEGKLNEKIASSILTIIEDPTDKKYPGYNKFDSEGTITHKKEIIKDGVLKTYLYDNKTAIIDKVSSTGNSYGGIGTSNMYVKPGKNSYEELLKELDNGIVISDYMGTSTAINTTNGNMSIQIIGYKVENGKIVSGIKPCIMTTTINDFLNNIYMVGNDLKFKNTSSGAVSVLIKDMKISS